MINNSFSNKTNYIYIRNQNRKIILLSNFLHSLADLSFVCIYRYKRDYVELVKCWPVIGKTSGEDDILNIHSFFKNFLSNLMMQTFHITITQTIALI